MTLNFDKCVFKKTNITFLGHEFSEAGVKPSNEKIQAITEMEAPRTPEALQAFLGLATYVAQKLMPHCSTLLSPLWKLLNNSKHSKFLIWSKDDKFKTVKQNIANISNL